MIVDTVDNLEMYASINPLFPKAIEYLKSHDMLQHELGKVQLDGTDLVINVMESKPKDKESARIETHEKFIDIQIPLNAVETMGYTPLCDLPETDYNEEKDIAFYPGLAADYFTVKPGQFAIFFPQDGHAPAITSDGIKKVVVKVRVK